MVKLVCVFSMIFLSGCVRAYFQPPLPTYKVWNKTGAGELDVKKALLECGDASPSATYQMYEHAFQLKGEKEIVSYILLTDACTEKSGFTEYRWTFQDKCSWRHNKHLPACQPNAKIPTPNVERRLNSWYCKIKTDYQYCLEHAVNPPACNPDGYKNPPPECLP